MLSLTRTQRNLRVLWVLTHRCNHQVSFEFYEFMIWRWLKNKDTKEVLIDDV